MALGHNGVCECMECMTERTRGGATSFGAGLAFEVHDRPPVVLSRVKTAQERALDALVAHRAQPDRGGVVNEPPGDREVRAMERANGMHPARAEIMSHFANVFLVIEQAIHKIPDAVIAVFWEDVKKIGIGL